MECLLDLLHITSCGEASFPNVRDSNLLHTDLVKVDL